MRIRNTVGVRAIAAAALVVMPVSALAQSFVEHRAYGAVAMGGAVPPPSSSRTAPPPWPSTQQAAPPNQTSGWQHRPKAAPVSLETSRPTLNRLRRVVPFTHAYAPGSLIIVNRERALYHVGHDGRAVRYPVAIGSFTEEWTGVEFVTDKKINPAWHPVQVPGAEPKEPVAGGDPANPLGARALYLGRTLWRIHGTPAADSIGQAVSAGCIRMHNEHVIELFEQVLLGTEVYVVDRLVDAPPAHRGKKVIE